jgi:hypothetical protein
MVLSLGLAASIDPAWGFPAQAPERWAVCYTDAPTLASLAPYGLLVFESGAHPPLETLREQGAVQRANGLYPYVASVDLQRIEPEPRL